MNRKQYLLLVVPTIAAIVFMLMSCGHIVNVAEKPDISEYDNAVMVLIPAGTFVMGDHHKDGDKDELPIHTVYLDAYYIDAYEVTNAQYAKFLNEYGKDTDGVRNRLINIDDEWKSCLIEKHGDTYKPKIRFENHPVVQVSWFGAAAYAQFYGKRLPTEAEWEKAAHGGFMDRRYPWGDTLSHNETNFKHTGGRDKWEMTAPVDSFKPNGYGLYDMAGNAGEWCADQY